MLQNLQLPMAVTDRRYRRNRCMLFQRRPVQSASAFPRLPRRFAPRNDKFESLMPPNYRPNTCSCQWRSGNALQTQSACTFLSLPCTNCKCLTPRFTRILRPAGGKNTALSGKTHIFPHVLRPKRRTMGGKPAKRITSQEKPTNAPEIFRNS